MSPKKESFLSHIYASIKEDIRHYSVSRPSISRMFHILRSTALPGGVQKKVLRQLIAAFLIFLLSCFLSFFYRDIVYLCGILIALGLAYLGFESIYRFGQGKIIEKALLCTTVKYQRSRKSTHLVFRSLDDVPQYYEFYYPGNGKEEFQPDRMYVIYYDSRSPLSIVGHVTL